MKLKFRIRTLSYSSVPVVLEAWQKVFCSCGARNIHVYWKDKDEQPTVPCDHPLEEKKL